MLFNSLNFLLFFPVVCILYWCLPNKFRNGFLLIASYYFYMCWEPVYALLIAFSTITTWLCGRYIGYNNNRIKKQNNICKTKRIVLTLCLVINFSILFIYKYLNFVTESIFVGLNYLGVGMEVPHFSLLLPVGISFFTFQAVGYSLDVYRGTISHEKNFWTYALFVSFFPQLVAGPIERAKKLLPQFHSIHKLDNSAFIEGLKLMVWGYFMKLGIAENVASYVDAVYNNIEYHNGTSIVLATFFFTFQIFCDFGGYSLIAIGAAKCLGFNLMQNFNHPYLASSVKDFWRRWHISLSTWFMDYLYIPLGGSRCSEIKHQRNLFLTMVISGIWHGANWTFVIWGMYHGILQCIYSLKNRITMSSIGNKSKIGHIMECIITFILVMIGWVFFRANTVQDAWIALTRMTTDHGMLFNGEGKPSIVLPLILIVLLVFKEIKDEKGWNVHFMHNQRFWISAISTGLMIVLLLLCASFNGGQFIYFQF